MSAAPATALDDARAVLRLKLLTPAGVALDGLLFGVPVDPAEVLVHQGPVALESALAAPFREPLRRALLLGHDHTSKSFRRLYACAPLDGRSLSTAIGSGQTRDDRWYR